MMATPPRHDWSRWLRQAVGGAAAAAALHAAPARGASCNLAPGVNHEVNVGVHFGLAFGTYGWPVKLNYGLTLRLGKQTAGYVRVEGLGISAIQLSGGATTIIGDSNGLIEGGIAGSHGSGLTAGGLHLAGGPGGPAGGLLMGGFLPLLGDRSAFNLQIAPILFAGEACLPSGRALRIGDAVALPPVLADEDCVPADAALAAEWIEDARAELASVPAFLRLAAELDAVGAPAGLRRLALEAADDERHHAAEAFALASRWAGSALGVAPLDAPPRFDRRTPKALTQLAIEALEDGCLGEGTAALAARLGLLRARDQQARYVLARIAPDEARHAELSWRILEWCASAGGSCVRDALAGAPPPAAAAGPDPEDAEWLSWNGRLAAAERSAARAQIEEQTARRLRGLLSRQRS